MSLIRSLLEELVVYRPVGLAMRRYGRRADGGYVMVDVEPCSAVYSFGVGDDVSFELAYAEAHDVPIYLHDPSVAGPPVKHPRFVFARRGVGLDLPRGRFVRELVGVGQSALHLLDPWLAPNPARVSRRILRYTPQDTLAKIIARHGDVGRRDLLLKADVEGAEYDAISGTPSEVLASFRQIALEVHAIGHDHIVSVARQLAMFRHLKATHALVHAHFNNYSEIHEIEGAQVPAVLELTFFRRDPGIDFELSTEPLPGALDYPNCNSRPDPRLDFWPFPIAG